MHRMLFAILLLTGLIAFANAQPSTTGLPTEEDTVVVGKSVSLIDIRGEVLYQGDGGTLVPVKNNTIIKPGERILVRKGASFSIGRYFEPEFHEDHWIKFKKSTTLMDIRGEVLRQADSGELVSIENGTIIKRDEEILVRRGASFSCLSNTSV